MNRYYYSCLIFTTAATFLLLFPTDLWLSWQQQNCAAAAVCPSRPPVVCFLPCVCVFSRACLRCRGEAEPLQHYAPPPLPQPPSVIQLRHWSLWEGAGLVSLQRDAPQHHAGPTSLEIPAQRHVAHTHTHTHTLHLRWLQSNPLKRPASVLHPSSHFCRLSPFLLLSEALHSAALTHTSLLFPSEPRWATQPGNMSSNLPSGTTAGATGATGAKSKPLSPFRKRGSLQYTASTG